jgi:hypothetical protein
VWRVARALGLAGGVVAPPPSRATAAAAAARRKPAESASGGGVLDTLFGNGIMRGVLGGERRRVSIGTERLTR